MKNKFIYPTIKNSLLIFIFFQIIPVIVSIISTFSLHKFLILELIALSIVFLWPLKPIDEMDERELALELKWKSRMFELMATCTLIPVILLTLKPETQAWVVLNSITFPAFAFIVILSILKRRDWGIYFYEEK